MLNRLPEKFSIRWFIVYLKTTLIHFVFMILGLILASFMAGQSVFEANMIMVFVFVAIANFIVCVFGFLNARYMFLLCSIAVFAGSFVSILAATEDYNGWEYFSAIMGLGLYSMIGFIISSIVQLVTYIKNRRINKKDIDNDEEHTEKDEKAQNNGQKYSKASIILLIIYIILLFIPIIVAVINLEPQYDKYNNWNDAYEELPKDPVEDTYKEDSFYIKYSEGVHDYAIKLTITNDKVLKYEEYFLEIKDDGEVIEKLNQEKKRKLSDTEFNELKDYVFKETEFIYLEDDLSTEENINDGPAAFITIKSGTNNYQKGGYYPFQRKDFRNIKNHLFSLVENDGVSEYEKIKGKDHPDEMTAFNLAGEFNSQLLRQLERCIDSYITVKKWGYDDKSKKYNINVEIEVEYTNNIYADIKGTIEWDLKDNKYNFINKDYEGKFLKRRELKKAIANIEKVE